MRKTGGLTASILQYVFYLNLLKACIEGSLQSQYVGCYYDNSSQANWIARIRDSSQMTIESCIQACTTSNATFALLQAGRDCMCGDFLKTSVPSYTCQIPCSGNGAQVCGGSNGTMAYTVIYIVCPVGYYGAGCDQVCHCKKYFPCYRLNGNCPNGCESNWTGNTCNTEFNVSARYIGCYGDADPDHRALTTYLSNQDPLNSIERCSSICASISATYLGLQSFSYCLCGESYDSYGTSTRCIATCTGNSAQICGGSFANSVYSVCPKGSYGKDCVAQCNCNDAGICPFSTGMCSSGCKPGWSGSSCSDRDCSSTNGACSANETCVTANLIFASVNRCQCSPGFQRTSLWDNCTDIDECSVGLCDKQTTTCTNTIGSFVCNCLHRYTPGNDKTFCEDMSSDASKTREQEAYPIGVIVGASIGSAAASSILTVFIGFVVVFCRRRRRQQSKKPDDAADNKETADAQVEHPIPLFQYETLNKVPKEYAAAYTELTGNKNRPEENDTRKKFEIVNRQELPVNEYDRVTSKIYEEVG